MDEIVQQSLKATDENFIYRMDVEMTERAIALYALVDIFVRKRPSYKTFLNVWPLYEAVYSQQAPAANERQRKALMVGSMSALSSAAFVAFSEDVLQAKPVIVDPHTGTAKRRHGSFVQANGLALPREWAGSMDAAVTNRLLHMLMDVDGRIAEGPRAEQAIVRRLVQGIFRAMHSGGQLMMAEIPPRFDNEDQPAETPYNQDLLAEFEVNVRAAIEDAGFTDIQLAPGWELGGVDYMFDRSRRFDLHERVPIPKLRIVSARKS
jgi:hypothetical protein